jgi:hypothetical protein
VHRLVGRACPPTAAVPQGLTVNWDGLRAVGGEGEDHERVVSAQQNLLSPRALLTMGRNRLESPVKGQASDHDESSSEESFGARDDLKEFLNDGPLVAQEVRSEDDEDQRYEFP